MKLRLVATVRTDSFNYQAGLMDTTAGWSYHAPRERAELGHWRDKYEYVDFFHNGLASAMRIVKGKEKWGYVNEEGKEVVKAKYDEVSDTHNGLTWVMLNGKYGFVNRKGKVVIALKYDYVDGFSEEGLANVQLNREWGKVDRNGKEYWDDDEMDFEGPHPGAAGGSNYNYTASEEDLKRAPSTRSESLTDTWNDNKTREQKAENTKDWRKKYDYVEDFAEGLAWVKLNGKFGLVNVMGEEVVEPKYDLVDLFREGLAAVKLNGKLGFVNLKGEEVIPLKYNSVGKFYKGLVGVMLKDKWGFIDTDGEVVVPLKYDSYKDALKALSSLR